jgi:hypothetical protein
MKNVNVETKEQIDMQSTEQNKDYFYTSICADVFNDDFGTGSVVFNNWVEVIKVEDDLIHVRVPIERRWDSLVKNV